MVWLFSIFLSIAHGIEDRGFWLLNQFQAEADCSPGTTTTLKIDFAFWEKAHAILSSNPLRVFEKEHDDHRNVYASTESTALSDQSPSTSTGESHEWFLRNVSSLLTEVTQPFGIVDPTLALECPLGTSALFQAYGEFLFLKGETH